MMVMRMVMSQLIFGFFDGMYALPPQTLSIRITTQTRRNADLEVPLVADNQVLEANTLEKSTSWTSPEKHPGMGAHSG